MEMVNEFSALMLTIERLGGAPNQLRRLSKECLKLKKLWKK